MEVTGSWISCVNIDRDAYNNKGEAPFSITILEPNGKSSNIV